MLYTDQGRLDVRRLQRLASGFKNYTTEPEKPQASAVETEGAPRRGSSRTSMAVAASSVADPATMTRTKVRMGERLRV